MTTAKRVKDLTAGDVLTRASTHFRVSSSQPPRSEGAEKAGLWRITGFVWDKNDCRWVPCELSWLLTGEEAVTVMNPLDAILRFGRP